MISGLDKSVPVSYAKTVYPGYDKTTEKVVNLNLNFKSFTPNNFHYGISTDNKEVGRVHFHSYSENYLYIEHMFNFTDGKIKGVGTAIIQNVVEASFASNRGGHVELQAAWNSHGFHWTMGFRILPDENEKFDGAVAEFLYKLKNKVEKENIRLDDPRIQENRYYKIARQILAEDHHKPESEVDVFKEFQYFSKVSESIVEELEKAKEEKREPNLRYLTSRNMFLPEESIALWKKIIDHPESRKENLRKLYHVPQPSAN